MSQDNIHSLLQRQLRQHFGEPFSVPAEWQGFVDAVNSAYREFEIDREMMSQTIELSAQELAQANSEMRTVFHALPDLLFRIDRTGTILDVKAGANAELLLDPKQMIGHRIQKVPFLFVSDELYRAIDWVAQNRAAVTVEYALRQHDEDGFYEARLAPMLEDQIAIVIRNITERKRAEESLFNSREMLRLILDTVPQRIFWKDRSLVYGGCNKPFAQDCGYEDPSELVGKTDFETESAPIAELYRADDQRVLESDQSKLNYEEPQLMQGGAQRWLRTSKVPLHDKEGRVVGVLGTYEDITERKHAEAALRQAEEKYRNIVENAVEGIFQSTPEGRVIEANPALARMLGYESSAELIAAIDGTQRQFYPEPARQAEFTRLLETHGVVQRFETRVNRKDGRPIWISVNARIVRDDAGQVRFYEGIAEDVTERKRLEEQFRQAQKMEAFGQLAGGVAHDFNNILTVIQSNASLLQGSQLTPAERATAIEETLRASERAGNLTRQLLTFSRRQPMQPKDLDVNEVVANMIKMFQRIIGEHIALETRYARGGAPVHADPGMLEQALMNLAVNSRDAMPGGGRLILETANVTLSEEEARASSKARPGDFVRLSVSDTGHGIEPENLPHIFEPFFTTKEVGKGTGLGLATVFGIVEQHNGWIEVESRVGTGSNFRIYFPRLAQRAAPIAQSRQVPAVRGGTETVLLVEDETAVRTLMTRMLERYGYKVHTAVSGVAALAVWQAHHAEIDLLITDMVMPDGISGGELSERLRAEKPSLRVIHCSGYTDEMFGRDVPNQPEMNFLKKPFLHHAFLQRVRECLDTR
jgi:two-component system, cell cycle sensor histidine kinase and response regulator CckA